jgi:hypothetical protein
VHSNIYILLHVNKQESEIHLQLDKAYMNTEAQVSTYASINLCKQQQGLGK